MPAYHEAFRAGERVDLADKETLLGIQQKTDPRFPFRLTDEQLTYAGMGCLVREVSYWHGGHCLYKLDALVPDTHSWPGMSPALAAQAVRPEPTPGFWSEDCLKDFDSTAWGVPLPLASEVYAIEPHLREGQPVVVVRRREGEDCLVIRRSDSEIHASAMAEVAALRNVLAFEWRYDFHGAGHDALRTRAAERRRSKG